MKSDSSSHEDFESKFRRLSDEELLNYTGMIPMDATNSEICDGEDYHPSS